MMKNNREDYASYHEWLEALKKDKLWLAQLRRLQSPNCNMQAMYAEALGLFDNDHTRRYWTIYQHDIESTLEEAWADVEITPSMLKWAAIGMLTLEWLKEHGLGEDKGERRKESHYDLLTNDVFSVDIFTTNERLKQLRDAIANAISWDDDKKIDLSSSYMWYWLYAALLDAGMFETNKNRQNRVTDVGFVNQIMKWFPDIIKNCGEGKVYVRKISKAMSTERMKWTMNGKPIGLRDVEANKSRLVGVKQEKIKHFIDVAYKGLYMPLVELKNDWN